MTGLFPTWWGFCERPENDGQPLHRTIGDPGGATNHGFTFATYQADAARLGLDPSFARFAVMTQVDFAPIAQVFFWNAVLADMMPAPVAMIWADFHFTSGGATACLQRALGVPADGVVGTEETLPAISFAFGREGPALAQRLTAARIAYYRNLNLPRFIDGWTRRANDCQALAMGLVLT
jgi:lysozyme family protein